MKIYPKTLFPLTILLLTVFMVSAQTRVIQSKPKVIRPMIKVELQSIAKYYMGKCPVEVKMTGKITASAPTTIKFRFEKSEGGVVKLQTMRLAKGVNSIPFKWKLNKNGQFWVKLLAVRSGKEYRSNVQTFEVKCDPQGRKKIIKRAVVTQNTIPLEQIGKVRIINPKPVVQKSKDNITEVPKVADLDIIGLQIYPNPGKDYKKIKFSITIKNISPYRTEHSKLCYLRIIFSYKKTNPLSSGYYESDPYFYVIPEISSGHMVTLELYFRFYKKTRWTVVALADGKFTIPEINEDNNGMWKYFYIK